VAIESTNGEEEVERADEELVEREREFGIMISEETSGDDFDERSVRKSC